MLNKYTDFITKVVTYAIGRAAAIAETAEKTDQTSLEILQTHRRPEDCWHIANNLSYSANENEHISFVQFVGGKRASIKLSDCWELQCISALYREKSVEHSAEQFTSPEELFNNFNIRCMESDINGLAFAVWQLYLLGHEHYIQSFVHFFELFDLRQDITHRSLTEDELQPYDICVCVTLLLARKDASTAAVNKLLGELPVFKGIADFWEDDEAFARFTERAAQWYLERSKEYEGKTGRFANTAANVLVPSWIFALDKFRQIHCQRSSSLGKHELLEIGQSVLEGAKAQAYPRLPTLVAAEAHYEKLFGKELFNPVPFWEKYLGLA